MTRPSPVVGPHVFRLDERGLPWMQTDRLVLRIADLGDVAEMVRFRNENREHLKPWEPARDEEYYSEPTWRYRILENETLATKEQAYGFVIGQGESPEQLIGVVNLREVIRFFCQNASLGYALDHRWENKGFMTEAIQATVWFGFNQIGLHRIEACYMPSNQASARVLEKVGFRIEGHMRESLMVDGRWEDHILAAIINES